MSASPSPSRPAAGLWYADLPSLQRLQTSCTSAAVTLGGRADGRTCTEAIVPGWNDPATLGGSP